MDTKFKDDPDLEPFLKTQTTQQSIFIRSLKSFTSLLDCPRDL